MQQDAASKRYCLSQVNQTSFYPLLFVIAVSVAVTIAVAVTVAIVAILATDIFRTVEEQCQIVEFLFFIQL